MNWQKVQTRFGRKLKKCATYTNLTRGKFCLMLDWQAHRADKRWS